jgi:hypothetical protein
MSYEIETRRNEWVAQQLGVQSVYRDDNCFVDHNDPEGVTAAFITLDSNGDELLMRVDGSHGYSVPDDFKLNLLS